MPLYEYECDACGQRFEAIRKFSESDMDKCSLCGKGPVRRLMSSPAIQFKGTGWYITDYSSKGKAGATESSGSSKGETKKSDSGSSDTSAAKSDSAASNSAKSSES